MTWDPITGAVDYVLLAGRRSPGLAEITGGASARQWDERRGYGLSGARVVFRGVKLSRPTLKLRLITAQDWVDWEAWRDLVTKPPPMVRPRAMDIWHPLLEQIGVSSVVVEDLSQPEQTGDGEWTITIKLIEYREPVYALAAPTASQEQAQDPVDAQIERLTAQVQALAR